MLNMVLTRYRVWWRTLDTIRLLSHNDDRLLADMGIERVNIAAIARRTAMAEAEQRQRMRQARTSQIANGPLQRAARS